MVNVKGYHTIDDDVRLLIEGRSVGDLSWLKDSIIHFTDTGSHAYGTATVDSDRDFKGVVIPPKEYLYGLRTFKSMTINTAPKDIKNSHDDIDITLYSIHEFMRLALNANPNVIDMLYIEEEGLYIKSRELVAMRDFFISQKLKNTFGGYGRSMTKRIERDFSKNKFNNKALVDAVRILDMGTELFTTGKMTVKRPNAQELIKYKTMDLKVNDPEEVQKVYNIITERELKFNEAINNTQLKSKPDTHEVEVRLMSLIEDFHGINK